MKLLNEIEAYIQKGYRSFLISGGLDTSGEIPYSDQNLEKLKHLKERYNLVYNFHVGFPSSPIHKLENLADVVSFDFFSDQEIMKKIYGIGKDPVRQIEVIKSVEVFSVPHVTIGIECGQITHEYRSIEMLSKYFDSIVLNILIPTLGTTYESCAPPSVEDVKDIFKYAKGLFEVVALGCMQPKGSYRSVLQNELANIADVIVKPVRRGINSFPGCCAFLLKQISQGVINHVR
ncbi:MAG: radical SAM protein [Pseudothermotoga sp.]